MHVRYDYRRGDEELVVQTTSADRPLSIRVTESDESTAVLELPEGEIDKLIDALRMAKDALRSNRDR